jgi:hypothetical protein
VLSGFAANLVPACATLPSAGAPLPNPTGGQNNYAPIANPTHTGTATVPVLDLTSVPGSSLFFGTTTTPNASITTVQPDNLNIAAGAHTNGSGGWIADATTAAIISANLAATSFFSNSGLTAGNPYGPTLVATIDAGGVHAPTFIGNGTPSITGGAAIFVNSNSTTGEITGAVTATNGNIFSPGFTCPHYVVGGFLTNPSSTVITLDSRSPTSIGFHITPAGAVVDYFGMSCI